MLSGLRSAGAKACLLEKIEEQTNKYCAANNLPSFDEVRQLPEAEIWQATARNHHGWGYLLMYAGSMVESGATASISLRGLVAMVDAMREDLKNDGQTV
jgi:hypothetical protein